MHQKAVQKRVAEHAFKCETVLQRGRCCSC